MSSSDFASCFTDAPPGYGCPERDSSTVFTSIAFDAGLNERDAFLGVCRCVVCGHSRNLEHKGTNCRCVHEPRNAVCTCTNHHRAFDSHEFIFVNRSKSPGFHRYHGKAVALDVDHRRAPFSSTFIIHEVHVRAAWPFEPDPHPGSDHDVLLHALSSSAETRTPSLDAGDGSSGWRRLAPVDDDFACVIEGTNWDGTAEENMQKYASIVGSGDSASEIVDA
ncbi:hypothetical protein BD309DRAFT_992117 [Dichomitus squalens]|nr:hypothetical protein BD309DRAFT_992117 [Dichomitus squalens]